MRSLAAALRKDGARTRLTIRFAAGERPHLFWIDVRNEVRVLSKRRADGTAEVVVTRDDTSGRRHALGELEVPPGTPAGWLDRLVETFADELGTRFERVDLRHIETLAEWEATAAARGWTHPGAA